MAQEVADHLSEELLWTLIKGNQPLTSKSIEHTRDCRDCRDLLAEICQDAVAKGHSISSLCNAPTAK